MVGEYIRREKNKKIYIPVDFSFRLNELGITLFQKLGNRRGIGWLDRMERQMGNGGWEDGKQPTHDIHLQK